MSRLTIDLLTTTSDSSGVLSVVPGASVNVYARNSNGSQGSASTVYLDGGATNTVLSQPLTSDAQGRIPGWLVQGDYLIVVSATNMTPYTIAYSYGGGGGGTGLQQDLTGWWTCDNTTIVPCDGAHHFLDVTMTGPPSWYNGSSTITSKGIYQVAIAVGLPSVAPTTSGLSFMVEGFNSTWLHYIDQLSTISVLGFGVISDNETYDIFSSPWGLSLGVKAQTDATCQLQFQVQIARVAY